MLPNKSEDLKQFNGKLHDFIACATNLILSRRPARWTRTSHWFRRRWNYKRNKNSRFYNLEEIKQVRDEPQSQTRMKTSVSMNGKYYVFLNFDDLTINLFYRKCALCKSVCFLCPKKQYNKSIQFRERATVCSIWWCKPHPWST